MKRIILYMSFGIIFLSACSTETIDVESNNTYTWQKYMNAEEYKQIQVGATHKDVVKIAGGVGDEIGFGQYEWPDEILLTKAYVITFEDNKVTEKKVIKKKGNSTR